MLNEPITTRLAGDLRKVTELNFDEVYGSICHWAQTHGITVYNKDLKPSKAGEFHGVSATMNARFPVEERTYYLVHALGSIVRWSLSQSKIQNMFQELRESKKEKQRQPARLEKAIEEYRAFETESSEFAVWLLAELGHHNTIPSFTNFMRADLEALTQFHRFGQAPIWRDFFAEWNKNREAGRVTCVPYVPKPIPPFQPAIIEVQEILQEQPK